MQVSGYFDTLSAGFLELLIFVPWHRRKKCRSMLKAAVTTGPQAIMMRLVSVNMLKVPSLDANDCLQL